jgi:hypothetical protein
VTEKFWKLWIFATTLGIIVGGFCGLWAFYTLLVSRAEINLSGMLISRALGSSLGGAFLGFAQWTILRGHTYCQTKSMDLGDDR